MERYNPLTARRALTAASALVLALSFIAGVRATNFAGSIGWYDDQGSPRLCDELAAANPGLGSPEGAADPCWYGAREDQLAGHDSLPACQDGVDNDSDELTDCGDPDCFGVGRCGLGEWCNVESAQFAGQDGDCGGDEGASRCQDGVDNDSDGLFDCVDPDCAYGQGTWSDVCSRHGDPVCAEYTCNAGSIGQDEWQCGGNCAAERCGDGSDNDGDGNTDCADPACASQSVCQTQPENDEARCSDGQDNDVDGSYDCSDTDCSGTSTCWWAWSGWNPGNWWSSYETDCGNGSDEDNDGMYDCGDSDCSADYRCNVYTNPVTTETAPWGYFDYLYCSNGNDDDYDGSYDCSDSDCSGAPACAPRPCATTELDADGNCEADYPYWGPACADGYDNDGDGSSDCADSDCSADSSCGSGNVPVSEIAPNGVAVAWLYGNGYCVDGIDNDGNGLTDCWDTAACNSTQESACASFTGLGTQGWPYDWRFPNGDPSSGSNGPTAYCGNGTCETGEDAMSCPGDCGWNGGYAVCGNGSCEGGEDSGTCPSDCGGMGAYCGDGACGSGEDSANCPSDCAQPPARCTDSSACNYDAEGECEYQTCSNRDVCGDGSRTGDEECDGTVENGSCNSCSVSCEAGYTARRTIWPFDGNKVVCSAYTVNDGICGESYQSCPNPEYPFDYDYRPEPGTDTWKCGTRVCGS